jgi:hypothetical protein
MILEASFGQAAFRRRRAARLCWTDSSLAARRKSDPANLSIAAPLRRETTLTIKQIAERLHLDTSHNADPGTDKH